MIRSSTTVPKYVSAENKFIVQQCRKLSISGTVEHFFHFRHCCTSALLYFGTVERPQILLLCSISYYNCYGQVKSDTRPLKLRRFNFPKGKGPAYELYRRLFPEICFCNLGSKIYMRFFWAG